VDRAARDGDPADPLEHRREAGGRGREQIPPGRDLERGARGGGEGGRAGPDQPHREGRLVAVAREREGFLQPDAVDRQIGPERRAGDRALRGQLSGEAQPPQVDRPGGAVQDQTRLRIVAVAGEADRRSRLRIGPETRGPARAPGDRPAAVEGEHDLQTLGGDPHELACPVGRDPGRRRAREQQHHHQR